MVATQSSKSFSVFHFNELDASVSYFHAGLLWNININWNIYIILTIVIPNVYMVLDEQKAIKKPESGCPPAKSDAANNCNLERYVLEGAFGRQSKKRPNTYRRQFIITQTKRYFNAIMPLKRT